MIEAGETDLRELRDSIWPFTDPKRLQDDWKQLTNTNLESPHSKSSALYRGLCGA